MVLVSAVDIVGACLPNNAIARWQGELVQIWMPLTTLKIKQGGTRPFA